MRTFLIIASVALLAGCASNYGGYGNASYTLTSFSTVNSEIGIPGQYYGPNVLY